MLENVKNRVLEPYVTTKPKGSGLGLAIVKKIVDEHGGRMTWKNLDTEQGILGAQVSVTLSVMENGA